jgi:pyruvate carboxylase
MGIRLDAGSAFSGAVVNPFYDSLLTKVSARGRTFHDAIARMDRALREFRIRGVKTNIPFLLKVLRHETFTEGDCTTRFIDQTPELFLFDPRRDRASRLLAYLGETIVNGNDLVKDRPVAVRREPAPLPKVSHQNPIPQGARFLFCVLAVQTSSQKTPRGLPPGVFAFPPFTQRFALLSTTTFGSLPREYSSLPAVGCHF